MINPHDFEEQVASYWEERDDFDARKLTSMLSPRIKKLLNVQEKAGRCLSACMVGSARTEAERG